MSPEPLLERTLRLLRDAIDGRHLTYREIATGATRCGDTEVEVDMEWLAKFKQGRIKEPGVNKVQSVHDFLSLLAANQAPRSNHVI